jgi:hypothetical protein
MSKPIWRRWFQVISSTLLVVVMNTNATADGPDHWWPKQKLPKSVLRTPNQHDFLSPRLALQMMVQSVAGLAAKAVNEGRSDEMVWVSNGNADLEEWYSRLLASHPNLNQLGTFKPWELVDHFAKRDVIKGYVLYRLDKSSGNSGTHRASLDCTVNVATSLAGVLDAIIVDEELESEAKEHGLHLLLDVRGKTQAWCFQNYKDSFNRRILCTQDPRKPHARDLAIAQKALTIYGGDEPTQSAMAWLEPISPILGWNGGDEFLTTDLSTRYGHIQTATDWCMNLPLLMAGAEDLVLPKGKSLDPATIEWGDRRSAVSFIETDGDNVQWMEGNFFHGVGSYWDNPERGRIPFGWSCCFAHLAQICPQAIGYAFSTRSTNDSFIEWGGGYYFPDHFGSERTNRWELLAKHARRTWSLMQATNTRIIGFNFARYDSVEAQTAYQVFASQTDGLLGILVFQYAPYEAGAGRTFWVKDGNGIEVPVITARYSIWEHSNNRPRAGTPAKIAREIHETVEHTPNDDLPRFDWAIAHAWSYFKKAPGLDENAENLPQESAAVVGGVRGYSPVVWCAARLPNNIHVASPEELIWRIRMKHDPAQTRKFMSQFRGQ